MGNILCCRDSFVINGKKYYKRELLGEGGFSLVYLVEDSVTSKLYALKQIICHSDRDLKIASNEVRFHEKFSSCPYVLSCVDAEMQGVPNPELNHTAKVLILLPFCPGGTLHDELMRQMKAGTRLPEDRILILFDRICEGLAAFHQSSSEPLVHRDLKTSNIILQDKLTPLIMDLGSVAPARVNITDNREARRLEDDAAERSSMPYRAPELFNIQTHTSIDESTDIWSLGCVLYAMCFYKSPFDLVYEKGDSVALATVSGNVSFPDPANHPYSEDLINLIKEMLQVEPEKRPNISSIIDNLKTISRKFEEIV